MDFLFSKLFWGMLVILIGMSIIINAIFKIDFPLIRVIFSLIIIFFGVNLLFGSFGVKTKSKSEDAVVFSKSNSSPDEAALRKEYSVVFGEQIIDLRNLDLREDRDIEFNVVFGKQEVLLPRGLNTRVKANAVFGNARFPDDHQVAFGEMTYKEKSDSTAPVLYIEGNVVFGQLRFIRSAE